MGEAEVREVTRLVQGILTEVDNGELEASTPSARALLRRLEGALIALEVTAAQPLEERDV
jgi:hypothetical protein